MNYIEAVVSRLIQKHGTVNPFEIASRKNITVTHCELGNTFGFFLTERRMKIIHINNALDYILKRFVCAHELAHAVLHPKVSTPFMRRSTFFSVDRIEREANEFAIKLLTYNEEILEGETKEQFCRRNEIPIEMERYLRG